MNKDEQIAVENLFTRLKEMRLAHLQSAKNLALDCLITKSYNSRELAFRENAVAEAYNEAAEIVKSNLFKYLSE